MAFVVRARHPAVRVGRPQNAAPLLVLLAAVVAGCATTPAQPTGPIVPGTAGAPREINVIMRDYLFEPDPIRLVPGETVRLNIINAGLLPHEFVLGDADVQAAWASAEAAATPPGFTATPPPVSLPPAVGGLRVYLDSGEMASAEYTVPTGERLELACQIPGHVEAGMTADVELVAGD